MATFALCSALMVWHTFNYLVLKSNDPQHPTIMLTLLGGHAGNGLSRYLTKMAGQKSATLHLTILRLSEQTSPRSRA